MLKAKQQKDPCLALSCINKALLFAPKTIQQSVQRVRSEITENIGLKALSESDEDIKSDLEIPDGIKVEQNAERGRFIVAARDIDAGELILQDQPLLRMLNKDFVKSHCWNCLRAVQVITPCDHCSDVIFCGQICLKQAYQYYHR